MTTAAQQTIINETARKLDVPAASVGALFDFFDQLRAQHGEEWRALFPGALTERARDGEPWAVDVLRGTAVLIREALDSTDHRLEAQPGEDGEPLAAAMLVREALDSTDY